jgi:hypothetical protein
MLCLTRSAWESVTSIAKTVMTFESLHQQTAEKVAKLDDLAKKLGKAKLPAVSDISADLVSIQGVREFKEALEEAGTEQAKQDVESVLKASEPLNKFLEPIMDGKFASDFEWLGVAFPDAFLKLGVTLAVKDTFNQCAITGRLRAPCHVAFVFQVWLFMYIYFQIFHVTQLVKVKCTSG